MTPLSSISFMARVPPVVLPGPSPSATAPPPREVWDRGLAACRLNYLLDRSDPDGARGSYAGWITRLAWEEMARIRNFGMASEVLRALAAGMPLHDYERLAARILGNRALPRTPWGASLWRFFRPLPEAERALNLSRRAGTILNRATASEALKGPARDLIFRLGRVSEDPSLAPAAERALIASAASPLALMRFQRLYLMLRERDGLFFSKLMELGDSNFHVGGPKAYSPQSRAYLEGVEDPVDELGAKAPDLIDDRSAAARRQRRRAILRLYPLTARGLEDSLLHLGDRFSWEISKAMQRGDFLFELLGPQEFLERVSRYYEVVRSRHPGSVTADPAGQEAVYFRAGLVNERAVMAVRRPPPSARLRPEDVHFEILARIAHEFQHLRDVTPEGRKTEDVLFGIELKGHAREFLWRAEHGSSSYLKSLVHDSPLGFGLSFRDDFERDYGPLFRRRPMGPDGPARRRPER